MMTKPKDTTALIKGLWELHDRTEIEGPYITANDLLLKFIDDPAVTRAYNRIECDELA
jgi:hypothetical protein